MNSFELVIDDLTAKLNRPENRKCTKILEDLIKIFKALDNREIPPSGFSEILQRLNIALSTSLQLRTLKKIKNDLIHLLEQDFQLVGKGHYQSKWMAFGIMFGITLGPIFSAALNNYAFVGIGLPIGMAVGIALGAEKDKKAKEEGRVLDF